MSRSAKFKCLHCKEFFVADCRNRGRQRYCARPECRAASKAASQRRWSAKEANRDYFRGADNVRRVQEWRRRHPGYWRRKGSGAGDALQDPCPAQAPGDQGSAAQETPGALQDLWLLQPAVLVGLISTMTGSTLQEDIARSARSFLARGHDILGMGSGGSFFPDHEDQTSPLSRAAAAGAGAV